MLKEEHFTSEEFLKLAQLRSKIYGFLSSIFIQIPDPDFVKKLLGDEVSLVLSSLPFDIELPQQMVEGLEDMKNFIRTFRDQGAEEVCQSLSVERTRLLRGINPGYSPPPPYESVYRDREKALMSESAVAVHREYARAGAGVPGGYKEPPDYIGLELDFMRFLTERETDSWRRKERDNALGYLNMERGFLENHITKWIPEFCDNVIERAELDFYRGIARMTKGFVNDDHEKVVGFAHIASQQ